MYTVSPAPAGMIPKRTSPHSLACGEPRTRGDDPQPPMSAGELKT